MRLTNWKGHLCQPRRGPGKREGWQPKVTSLNCRRTSLAPTSPQEANLAGTASAEPFRAKL
eukprot:7281264-Prorocentrum_lima.AAC.1